MTSQPRPIVFDTDIGSDVDDALALALILAAPEELEFAAVTTVSSNVAKRAELAAGLLALAGRTDVDVCAGEAAPLLRHPPRFNWFGHEEKCRVEGQPVVVSDEPAPARIVRAAREHEGLEVVLVGPLTNMARALALDPELPRRLGGVTIMGGHVREVRIGDFVAPHGIDYNLCSDPEASVAVLGSGCRITLVTADVTLSTWLHAADLERLRGGGALQRELARQVDLWTPVQRTIFTGMGGTLADDNVAFLHDPLTVLALFDASALEFEELHIVPTIEAGVLRTREVQAGAFAGGLGAPMRVATAVDARAAERAMLARWLSLGVDAP